MIYKIFFVCLLSFVSLQAERSSKDTIYIYAGPGTSKNSLLQTAAAMNAFSANYTVEYILPEQLITDNWEAKAALLVIPGGADIPYTKALNGIGNQKIRSYVENGGSFLGICAGSYYGGEFVDFAKGTEFEVQGNRELSFFPGVVRGPILAPFDYQTESGARAAKITWKDPLGFQNNTLFTVFYNGGGYFVDAGTKNQTTVLASYDTEGKIPAIIECKVGSGKVILSGVHFEYDPHFLDASNEYLQQIIPAIQNENPKRIQLLQHLLSRLNLPAQDIKFTLRPAVERDAHTVYQLVREIREFHERDPNTVSEAKIRKYGFGEKPLFKVELAEVDQKIVGMAIYYIGWAGFEGYPEIVLEDIYVKPDYRGYGIGTAFFRKIAQYGVENDCERIVFEVSNWNEKAFAFYEKLGAKKMDDLSIVRIPRKAMENLVDF